MYHPLVALIEETLIEEMDKKVVLLLLVVIVILAIANIYPLAAPLIAHHQMKGMVGVIIADLLTSYQQSGIGQYYVWILLGVGAIMYAFIGYDLKNRRQTTHGSAHHVQEAV